MRRTLILAASLFALGVGSAGSAFAFSGPVQPPAGTPSANVTTVAACGRGSHYVPPHHYRGHLIHGRCVRDPHH